MKPLYWRLFPFIIFMLLAMFFWRGLSLDPHQLPSAQLGKRLPFFQLPRLDDEPGSIFTTDKMLGHVVILNVWASWCAACIDEEVFLLRLAREGVLIYGLNYKDNQMDAKNWLANWGNPYQMIGADLDGRVAMDLGVFGAPETFLIDKQGMIRYRHAGLLDAQVWMQEFMPRIRHLEQMT